MENKYSWKKTLAINYRAFKLLLKKYPSLIISEFLSTVFNAITPYVTIYMSALIIDALTKKASINQITSLIIWTLIITFVCGVINALLNKWRNAQSAGQPLKLQEILSEKMNSLDFEKVDNANIHEIINKIELNDNGGGWGISNLLTTFKDLIRDISSLIAGLSLTISLFASKVPLEGGKLTILNNPLFILVIILVLILVSYISPYLSYISNSYWAKHANSHVQINNLFSYYASLGFQEDIATDVRIYRQDKIAYPYLVDKNSLFNSKGFFAKLGKGRMGILEALSAFTSYVLVGIIYLFVCLKAYGGAFGLGRVTQYVASLTKVGTSLSSLMNSAGKMKNNAHFLGYLFEFLDIKNDMYQGDLRIESKDAKKYEIEFKNVSFKYPNTDFYALKNVNFKFKVGSRIAAVGVNGSGKTTFIKLLCRLYDPTEGEILLNGINIRNYNYQDYMNIFAIVFQDFKIFAFKLGENIACSTKFDQVKVVDCLTKAGFKSRLEKLTDGLDTYLYKENKKDGVSVSGGEAQKIAIARALYKAASFIILDEPTAALDPIAEAEIYSKFNEIVEEKTSIYISHRLSSCKFCDEILVFDQGNIIQNGKHDDLLKNSNGKYFELWNAQAKYYCK